MRIKEQETRLTLQEHNDDDDDDEIKSVHKIQVSWKSEKNERASVIRYRYIGCLVVTEVECV